MLGRVGAPLPAMALGDQHDIRAEVRLRDALLRRCSLTCLNTSYQDMPTVGTCSHLGVSCMQLQEIFATRSSLLDNSP